MIHHVDAPKKFKYLPPVLRVVSEKFLSVEKVTQKFYSIDVDVHEEF